MVIRLVSAGSNAESSANPGLFFSFGDDDEEMYTISSTMDANEKLGKATGMKKKKTELKTLVILYLSRIFLFVFQAGLLNKLMHNMGSPFTNTVMPQLMMGEKIMTTHANTSSISVVAPPPPPFALSPKVSDQPEVTLNQRTLINLKECGIDGELDVVFLILTWDAGHLIAILSPPDKTELSRNTENVAAERVSSHNLLFKFNVGEAGLVERPVCQLKVAAASEPRCVVMLPSGDRRYDSVWSAEEAAAMRGPMRAVVVT
jgi:hypothetical protein